MHARRPSSGDMANRAAFSASSARAVPRLSIPGGGDNYPDTAHHYHANGPASSSPNSHHHAQHSPAGAAVTGPNSNSHHRPYTPHAGMHVYSGAGGNTSGNTSSSSGAGSSSSRSSGAAGSSGGHHHTHHNSTPTRGHGGNSAYAQHASALSVEPMRSVPFASAASSSATMMVSMQPSSPTAAAAASGADWSRTHGHSRSSSLATSRRPSVEVGEKMGESPSHNNTGNGNGGGPSSSSPSSRSPTSPYSYTHTHPHGLGHARIPSPLAQGPHFPPAWTEPAAGAGVEAQCPPRVRPPVRDLFTRALRDRLSGNSKSGALGRGLMIGWVITTLGFVAAAAFWKGELFAALDSLSKDLYDMGYQGLVVFGVLIFITTIPPLPLYSTLIVLSGYTFGVWYGFIASYVASLVGAVVVFVISRTLLRDAVTRSLASSPTATSLLQIIPQNPHLLLLIRIAPYPYNLLNVVLASAPTLTLKTYTFCTAISLCKLVLHTWIGAGIHDLSAAYAGPAHGGGHAGDEDTSVPPPATDDDAQHARVKAGMTWGGIIMCCLLFVYLTHLAKRAIAQAQEGGAHHHNARREEEVAFLTPMGDARDLDDSF